MSTTRSREKLSKVKPLFDAVVAARNSGDLEKATDLCGQVLKLLDESDRKLLVIAHGELGYIYRQRGEPAMAVLHYGKAVKSGPRSELASLGLFHSFVELGDWERGLEEVVRFLNGRDSPEYRELLAHGFGDDLPSRARVLADQARSLIAAYDRHTGQK